MLNAARLKLTIMKIHRNLIERAQRLTGDARRLQDQPAATAPSTMFDNRAGDGDDGHAPLRPKRPRGRRRTVVDGHRLAPGQARQTQGDEEKHDRADGSKCDRRIEA